MVDFKVRGDLAPRLALQAVHAAEVELVAQPRAIPFVGSITRRAVPSLLPRIRVIEYQSGLSSGFNPVSRWSKARAPLVGKFVAESTWSRIIWVSPASSMTSAGDIDPSISLSISSNRRRFNASFQVALTGRHSTATRPNNSAAERNSTPDSRYAAKTARATASCAPAMPVSGDSSRPASAIRSSSLGKNSRIQESATSGIDPRDSDGPDSGGFFVVVGWLPVCVRGR